MGEERIRTDKNVDEQEQELSSDQLEQVSGGKAEQTRKSTYQEEGNKIG